VTNGTEPPSLRDPATLLRAWEAGLDAPPVARGAVMLQAVLETDVLGLPLPALAAIAVRCYEEAFGVHVEGVMDCETCGSRLEVTLRLPDVVRAPTDTEDTTPPPGLQVRVPTTRDLLDAEASAHPADTLLDRCVTRRGRTGTGSPVLGQEDRDAVDRLLERLAGAALPLLRATCPECGSEAVAAVDPTALLAARVEAEVPALLADIAALARAFGWAEADVLALPPRRRAAYLALAQP
jgi:hypothetical protein